ncbi:hypothetical protein [Streptomyces sp. NPDC052701]|uniref:hypothetical protein n=1 Tax=Streptomyces sp. NPDC052701 TaxID=3155533 RepID=UPI003434B6A7
MVERVRLTGGGVVIEGRSEPPPGAASRPKTRSRYLRVAVNSVDSSGGDGPSRVNARVPLRLLRAGVRLASLIPAQALTEVNAELNKPGVPIDLTEPEPQHLEEFVEQLDDIDLGVGIDDPDAKVRVFCE